jgi:uncharacterized protein YjbI with pentapeptide repeats
MAIQYDRKFQPHDYRSAISTVAFAGYRWIANHLHRWTITAVGWASWMQASSSFRFGIEMVTVVGVLITVVGFWVDRSARVENRVHQAWTLVASNEGGNIGLIEALEFLNDENIHLSSLDANNAHLYAVELRGANLNHSNFENAELSESMLAEAKLGDAKLIGAKLFGADLTGATLVGADLTGAKLGRADLTSINLDKADLTEANLQRANLTGASLTDVKLDGAIFLGATLKDAEVSDHWPTTVWFCNTTMPDGTLNDNDCATLEVECEALASERAIVGDYMEGPCEWQMGWKEKMQGLPPLATDDRNGTPSSPSLTLSSPGNGRLAD